jgi:hypothetical protein
MIQSIDTLEGQRLIELTRRAAQVRGPFLEQAIAMDILISDILSQHFCANEERRTLLYSLILADMNFSSRIDKLKRLLKIHYEDLSLKYPELFSDLTAIREFRNDLAHDALDTSDEVLQDREMDRIYLLSHKNGKRQRRMVTAEEVRTWFRRCTKVIMALVFIQGEIVRRTAIELDASGE